MTLQSFSHDVAVCMGRFQPFHNGHLALLQRALSLAPRCVVLIRSAYQPRTPRNPFSWTERAEMMRLALSAQDQQRTAFVPMRDDYDLPRWTRSAQRCVAPSLVGSANGRAGQVVLVSSGDSGQADMLSRAAGWDRCLVDTAAGGNGAAMRDAWFQARQHPEAGLSALVDQVPITTREFLHAWAALPFYQEVAEEWQMLKRYREEWAGAPYPPIFVTVDVVLRCAGQVLLVRRGRSPGKGLLALPGGFIEPSETAWNSALRELREETRIDCPEQKLRDSFKACRVFDHPERSQRGRTITHAHYLELQEKECPKVQGGDDAASAVWVPIENLCALEDQFLDDHFLILDHFLEFLEREEPGAL